MLNHQSTSCSSPPRSTGLLLVPKKVSECTIFLTESSSTPTELRTSTALPTPMVKTPTLELVAPL